MKNIFKKKKEIIKGYKAFGKGLICRGFQYELGKDFVMKEKPVLCSVGFHFCKNLSDVYSYYAFDTENTVVCEVEAFGDVVDEEEGNKSATNGIRLIRVLNAEQAANNNGNKNVGHSNTGDSNTGNRNTGDSNTGNRNTGHSNTGHSNTGHSNTGDSNTGNRNTGHSNTGHSNTGHRNTGHSNTGHRNTGNWNTSNFNTGSFNTNEVNEVLVFNKTCLKKEWDAAEKPNCLYFSVNEWVNFEDMTKKEKESFGTAKFTGGFMRKLDYKDAFSSSMKKASKEEIELVKKLPNFDAKVFEEISGFKIK